MAANDNDKNIEPKSNTEVRRGRLPGSKRYRLKNLLHMKYKPSEIARELDIGVRWFYRVYLQLGCPHEKTESGSVWIVGTEFRKWYEEMYRKKDLNHDEAYCVSCKKIVPIINPKQKKKDGLTYVLSDCPDCDGTVAKILSNRRRSK